MIVSVVRGGGTYTEEVDEEVVGDGGEVGEVGDAEERGIEGEGEQGGRAHRLRSGSRARFIARPLPWEAKVAHAGGAATLPSILASRTLLRCCVCRQPRRATNQPAESATFFFFSLLFFSPCFSVRISTLLVHL